MAGFTLLAIVQTELRLLVRQLSSWLYLALLGGLAIIVVISAPVHNNWMDTLVRLINNIAFFQFPIMALVVASSIVRNRHRVGEWLWSTRLESPLLILGQTLALVLSLGTSLLIPLTVAWALLVFGDVVTPSLLPAFWFYGITLLLPITFLEFGVVFSLSLWLRHPIPVVLVTAGLDALLWLGILMPTATLLTPLNHTLMTLRLDPVAGFGAERLLIFSLLLLYTILPIALLALSTWGLSLIDRRSGWRPGHGWRLGMTMVVGLVATLFAFGFYRSAVRSRTVPSPVVDQVDTWLVTATSCNALVVDFSIRVDARLTLRNASDLAQPGIVLALNPGLQVSQASINNRPVNVQREGEAIRLTGLGSPIDSGETVEVLLIYSGSPYLLREDYSLVSSIAGQNPTAFSRPVRTYLDSRVILLQRDGDWRPWPFVAGPHASVQGDEVKLTVYGKLPIISSSEVVEQRQSETIYRWSGQLPQFLLASAPYRIDRQANGTIFVAPLSDRRDAMHASMLLALRRALANWLEGGSSVDSYQAAILPYVANVILGGSVVGLPAMGQAWRVSNAEDVHENAYPAKRGLATALSQAWLVEQIAWPAGRLSTEGQLRSFIMECDEPDETGQQRCVTRSLGGVNLQAPAGRLVEEGDTPVLLHALGVVIGQYITLQVTGNQEAVNEERQLWSTVAMPKSTYSAAKASEALALQGLMSRHNPDDKSDELAHLVLELNALYDDLGDSGFAQFVQELITRYPVGSVSLTEDVFWQVAGHYTANLDAIRNSSYHSHSSEGVPDEHRH